MLELSYMFLARSSFGPPPPSVENCPVLWNICTLHILVSGDYHPNPGPPKYKFPCVICEKPCRTDQRAVACDDCESWYHTKCMGMPPTVYRVITPNVSWVCFSCGIPNFSSTLFDTPSDDSVNTSIATENTYSILSDSPPTPGHTPSSSNMTNSFSSIGSPQFTSSPTQQKSVPHKKKGLHSLCVLVINLQSMRAKRTSFWLLLEEIDPDIIIGSETWLYPGISESKVLPSGYRFITRKDRNQDRHGGVIIAAKDSVTGTDLRLNTHAELAAASFVCQGKDPLIVASIYRPPNSDLAYTEEVCSQIRQLHLTYPTSTIWLAGDINLPDIDWNTGTITSINYLHSMNKTFLDTVLDTSSEQIVNFTTRGQNILDLFITNRPTLVERCKPLPGVSDHDAIFVQVQTSATRLKPPRRKILLWKNANPINIQAAVSDFSSDFTSRYTSDTDINILWNTFRDFVGTTIDIHIPSKMSSTRYNKPWITRKAKRLSRKKKRAFRRARATGNGDDISRYKQAQKDTRYECRKAYNSYISDLVTTNHNPKKLYSLVKEKRRDNSGISPLKSGGVSHRSAATKASILNNQFGSVFTKEDTSHIPSLGNSPNPDIQNFTIGEEGVRKLLKDLDPHKATGPDNIPTKFLKDYAKELTPSLTLIFSASIAQGEVPSEWKHANVTPIFKKGDHSDPTNYRPISLTSVCSKLIEHILHSQIMAHLDKHRILSDQQHGVRKRRSTESQLVLTLQDLAQGLDEGEQIDTVLLDFSKAFDKVPHVRLVSKLQYYGIRGKLLQWIRSFLANRTQQVLVEGTSSGTAPVTSGVPQCFVIGPLLLPMYINDLHLQVTSTSRLFADDSILYRKIRSAEDARALQDDLNRLQQWERD